MIWVKTEYQGQRRLRDVRLILAEQDSCYASRDQIEPDPEVVSTGPVTSKLNTGGTGKTNGKEGKGKKETNGNKKESPKSTTDPPKQVSTDAFLSIPDTHLCEKNTPGAEFIAALTPDIKKPTDRTISKSWYSAFRETQLLMLLQSRLVTEVYICGAMTNTSVYATALDAVQFGLKVLVPSDCCGFRYLSAHRDAMAEMTGKLGVETMSCTVLLRLWDSQRNNGDDDATQVHTMDTAQLAVVVENAIRAGEGGVQLEEPPASDAEHDGSEDHYDDYNSEDMEVARRKGMSVLPNPESTFIAMDFSDCKDNVCAHFYAYIFLCSWLILLLTYSFQLLGLPNRQQQKRRRRTQHGQHGSWQHMQRNRVKST